MFLAEITIDSDTMGVIVAAITVLGAVFAVYVKNETRAAVQQRQLDELGVRMQSGDTQMEKLKDSMDQLRLTLERLLTLEESRIKH